MAGAHTRWCTKEVQNRKQVRAMVKPSKKLKKVFLILGITGLVYAGFRYLLPLVIPFLAAYIVALGLKPSAHWLHCRLKIRWKGRQKYLPVGIIGGAELILAAGMLGAAAYWGIWRLCKELVLISDSLPEWIGMLDVWLTENCHRIEHIFHLNPDCLVVLMRDMLSGLSDSIKKAMMPFLMENSMAILEGVSEFMIKCVLFFLAAILSLEEMEELKRRRDNSIFWKEYAMIGERLASAGKAYLKTQGSTLFLTILICMAGLWLMGNPYYIVLGIAIGVLDALPVLGTGTVFLPWAVFCAVNGNWGRVGGLVGIYLICYFLREFMEARIMGNEIGLTPLESLVSIYVGWQLFGFWGFILGPIGLILIEDIIAACEGRENGKTEGSPVDNSEKMA